ncbi:MAG: thioredoxin-disulfide reductase [Thermoanaerobacteraceae bacterium]|nr:thioredoxin-disulfide reductase [Thermoanaerobacteraceae bacterium]
MHDVIIIGGGPAGLTAGLYSGRANLKTLIIEKKALGGQAATTYNIENYPGYISIAGPDLTMKMEEQVKRYNVEITYGEITSVDLNSNPKKIVVGNKEYETKVVILAMGAYPREIGLESEQKLRGMGVSYCATCDGAFFNGRTVAVVGGGNTAIEDATFLTRYAEKVYVIHRRNELRATKAEQDKAFKNPKIEFIWDSVVEEIKGNEFVEGAVIKNVKTGEKKELKLDGIFVAIGNVPDTEFVKGIINLDENGYILGDEEMRTNIPGVFAAGDVRKKSVRQLVTAMSDGAIAAINAEKYLSE